MEKRYQVFVSSTFRDLQEERAEVIRALLELDCFPSGMELFPAADDDQWTLIKEIIDACDVYIVIVAGRYGSVDAEGVSYTEKEYRYALQEGKPVLGFVHRDSSRIIGQKLEEDADKRKKLDEFSALVREKMCKEWDSPGELGGVVSRSLIQTLKRLRDDPDAGWVRANQLADTKAKDEIIRLQNRLAELEANLGTGQLDAAVDSRNLAWGDEVLFLDLVYLGIDGNMEECEVGRKARLQWNELFYRFGPWLLDGVTVEQAMSAFGELVRDEDFVEAADISWLHGCTVHCDRNTVHTILLHLEGLKLVYQDRKNHGWGLTDRGRAELIRMRAITSNGVRDE